MESENILAVNVPNLITITIMAALGAFLLGLIYKGAHSAMSNGG
jgi:hypothetical protein